MTTSTPTMVTTQVYRVYIKASPAAVWDAITKPEWTERYGYGGRVEYDLRAGGRYRHFATQAMRDFGAPEVILDGEVVAADPPRRLVQTWRMLMDEALAAEGFTRITWEIDPIQGGATRLTVTHDLSRAPKLARLVSGGQEEQGAGGGWSWVLSDLKTVLETGQRMSPWPGAA